METMYLDARETMQTLGVSRGKAYKIIQQLNDELKAQGYVIIAGKCSRKFFNEKFYGCGNEIQNLKGEMQ
jgi:hypothetical protein